MSFSKYLPQPLNMAAERVCKIKNVSEIRLAPERYAAAFADKPLYITKEGELTEEKESAIFLSGEQFYGVFEKMCDGSPYSKQESLKEGFLSLPGGVRAGVCGRAIISGGSVSGLCDVSGINIRIARQIFTAADRVIDKIAPFGKILNTIIISPPGCGKTTMLREISRLLGRERRVVIADERGEIAAMCQGVAGFDIGENTFVYTGFKKADAILMAIRALSPDVIICDEIGSGEDGATIFSLINAGVKIICSCHGFGKEDVLRRPSVRRLMEGGIFERIIVLGKDRQIKCF